MYRIFSVESIDQPKSWATQLYERLQSQGYELFSHQPGQDLLAEVRNEQPDLILMDPTLPLLGSFETCRLLKDDPDTETIPVIFIHSGPANGKAVQGFDSGATDFISIELGEIEIMARLKAAIRNKQAASQSVALAKQLNRMNTELYERNLQVEKELYVARQLQQSLLPPFIPEETPAVLDGLGDPGAMHFSKCHYRDDKLKITGLYLPCDALGGDIYDIIKFQNDTVGVAIADVSGHGVPAGFITAIFKSSFYRTTHSHSQPGDILYHLNNELADIVKTGEYVTALYCRVRPDEEQSDKMLLDYSGAGHPYPYYYNAASNGIDRLKANGTPLVWVKNMDYPMGTVSLQPGDKVLLFTDGVSEMRNAQGDMYGEEKLNDLFQKLVEEKSNAILDELIRHLSDFTEGHPLEDDLSMVLIEAL